MFVYPALLVPTAYTMFQSYRLNMLFKAEVHRIWLMQNGDQLVVQTYDGMLHKLNIMDNDEYEIFDAKDKTLVFQMQNSGR